MTFLRLTSAGRFSNSLSWTLGAAEHTHLQSPFHSLLTARGELFLGEPTIHTTNLITWMFALGSGLHCITAVVYPPHQGSRQGDLDKSVGTLHTSLGLDEVVSAQTLRCDMIDNKKQKNSAHQQLQTQISINEEDMCSINDAGDMKAGNIQVTEKLIVDQSLDMIIPKTQGTTSVEKKQFDTRFSPTSGILNLSPLKEVAAHNYMKFQIDMQYAELI
ncbi:hypothetical protein Btru_055030 [Bulinus truncatus]|nr:hypothetical protein Btru_055030 [Bulinus truncatus]